jgi:hypothetical protein
MGDSIAGVQRANNATTSLTGQVGGSFCYRGLPKKRPGSLRQESGVPSGQELDLLVLGTGEDPEDTGY